MPNMMDSDSFATAIATFHNVIVGIGYALFGLIILAITYFLSMKTFKSKIYNSYYFPVINLKSPGILFP